METQSQCHRIKIKIKNPNPLFEKWLTEWRDQAKANNSKMQYTFSNALVALKKYPLPLQSGKDCIILKGFGKTLCDMIDKKLQNHNTNHEEQNAIVPRVISPVNKQKTVSPPKKSKPVTSKPYLPVKRSGAYAILLTLLKKSQAPTYSGPVSKTEIIEQAQFLSDKSFKKADQDSFYTAWSSMATLISKGLVVRKGSPPKFSLTEQGEATAMKLLDNLDEEEMENPCMDVQCEIEVSSAPEVQIVNESVEINNCNVVKDEDTNFSQSSSKSETFIFPSNSFDIILLVDTQETAGYSILYFLLFYATLNIPDVE